MSSNWLTLFIESFPKILIPGLTRTIPLTAISFTIAMGISILTAMAQYAKVPVLSRIIRFYIWIFRGTPLLVQLFVVFYGLPRAGILLDPFPAAVIVFSLNEGAYGSETVRAALESVPVGQMEAGRSLGLTYAMTMRTIILPQAFKNILPALGNEFISLVKETSVISVIAVNDLMKMAGYVGSRTWDVIPPYVIAAAIYLVMTLGLTRLMGFFEKKMARSDRH